MSAYLIKGKDAEVAVGPTFSSEVQMILDPPLPLFQLLGQLSVLPAWKHTHTHSYNMCKHQLNN